MGDVCVDTETSWNSAPAWIIISMSDVTVHTSMYKYVLIYTSMHMDEHSISQTLNILCLSLWTAGCHVLCMGDVFFDTETSWNSAPVWIIISMSDVTVHTSMY